MSLQKIVSKHLVILLSLLMIVSSIAPAFAEGEPLEPEVTEEAIEMEAAEEEITEDVEEEEPGEEISEEEQVSEGSGEESEDLSEEVSEEPEIKDFVFEDDDVIITASGILPEGVIFECEKIEETSETYPDIFEAIQGLYENEEIEIVPYDVRFMLDGAEIEPESIDVKFEFKTPIEVNDREEVSVVHIGDEPEIVKEDIADGDKVEEFEISLDSLSPIVLTKTSPTPLKSIQKDGYWISKTSNIDENGVGRSKYRNNEDITDTITAEGAVWLDVEIRYGGETAKSDYLYLKDRRGDDIKADANGRNVGMSSTSGYWGRIGGGVNFEQSFTDSYESPQNVLHYRFDTDYICFKWTTDSTKGGYGYYAIITPHYIEEETPDFHFEELEDGTYALVFDKGGVIDGFLARPELQEQIEDYKDNISEIRLHKNTTAIDGSAFSGLTSLKTVTIPNNSQLTEIGYKAFYNCINLESINVPESVTSIGTSAFSKTPIRDISFLEHVETIGEYAFYSCNNLTNITITDTTSSIGEGAFKACNNITDFIFEDGTSFPTLPANFFENMSNLRSVRLPSDLTEIPAYCFQNCTQLQGVEIPEGVTKIGRYAFNGCSALRNLDIPPQLTNVGDAAFKGCSSLTKMEFPETVNSIGESLFYGCTNLRKVTFDDNCPITVLPKYLFYNCTNLKTVKLPDGVTAISDNCFTYCSKLEHVDLPENLISIGVTAFFRCSALRDISLNDSLTTIGGGAFNGCSSLEEVIIPNSVTNIGDHVWTSCSNLTSAVWEPGSQITKYNTGEGLFSYCEKLEELVLPEGLKEIPKEMAYQCKALKHIDIPDSVTTIGVSAFSYSALEQIDLPANLDSIGNSAFSFTKLKSVIIPNQVTVVNGFSNCASLESVIFEPGGKNCVIGSSAFSSCPFLEDIEFKSNITKISSNAFYDDLCISEITISSGITSVENGAFSRCRGVKRLVFENGDTDLYLGSSSTGQAFSDMSLLEELIIDRNITSSNAKTDNLKNINPEARFVIGEHVDTLDNMFISLFTEDSDVVFEGENDFSVSTRINNTSEDPKWSTLKGDFYVDANGAVYKLDNNNNTASLFHVPKGLASYTVPETITSVAGVTYTIDKIESYAVRDASDLAALTVEAPENIVIPQFAFSKCPTLLTINNKPEIFPEEWAEVSILCDFPVHTDISPVQVPMIRDTIVLGDPEEGVPPTFSFGVTITGQESMDDLTYVYPTGRSARLDFTISNESNIDMSDRVIRIYLAFDGSNYSMGNYDPGQNYTLINSATGERYPFKVRETDAKGVYYYEITGFAPGDTLAFNNQFTYLSPSSAGGTLRIWAESLSSEEAAQMEGKTSQPDKYMLAEWYTTPTPYSVEKKYQYSGNCRYAVGEDDNIYVHQRLNFTISMKSAGSSGNTYAKDHIKYVEFSDDLILKEGLIWHPLIVEAVRNGDYRFRKGSNSLEVKINGKWEQIVSVTGNYSGNMIDLHPEVVTDNNGNDAVRINWTQVNPYWTDTKTAPTAEFPAVNILFNMGDAIIVKPGSDLWAKFREGAEFTNVEFQAMSQISNKVTETAHYSFSADQTNTARAPWRIIEAPTGLSMTKAATRDTLFGKEEEFEITLTNNGLIHRTDVDVVTDAMVKYFYIKPEDMEAMFNDEKWGPYLNVDVTSATICEKPEKTPVDVDGKVIPNLSAQQLGADPIPYNGCAHTDNSVITESAKLSFCWDTNRQLIVMKVKNDAGIVQQTKTIGSGGDYSSIREAVDDIGYVVTFRAVYTVTWDLGDDYTLYNARKDGVEANNISDLTPEQILQYEYTLRGGKTDTFTILSRVKETPMLLTEDEPEDYHDATIETDLSNNRVYARNERDEQIASARWEGRLLREMVLSKYVYINGHKYFQNENINVYNNTVIEYETRCDNDNGDMEVLPLTDRMTGSQALLVPVNSNKHALFTASGSSESVELKDAGLDTYIENSIRYYILNKNGIYKHINVENGIADTITVTKTQGSLDTLLNWYFRDTASAKVNYKALVDISRFSEETSYNFRSESWAGGHQTHRLYASLGGTGRSCRFRKWIVEDPDAVKETLIEHSMVKNSDEVLYKIVIENLASDTSTVTGDQLRDELPSTAGAFSWTKEDITDIYYVTKDARVDTQSRDYWYVDSIEPTGADTASRGLYYIHWTNDFRADIEPGGELWIYIKLQFPGDDVGTGDEWDHYIATNNGSIVTNHFYVGERQSYVTHELIDKIEGVLQKGVLDTGLSSVFGGGSKYKSEDTRQFYQNGTANEDDRIQIVAYYTVLYNSGNTRLYLDDFQDQLPKGVKFQGLINYIPADAETSSEWICPYSLQPSTSNALGSCRKQYSIETERGVSYPNHLPIATVTDGEKTVVYKNTQISLDINNSNNNEQLVFYISNGIDLNKDTSLNKYYLNPGEAIRFGYYCRVQDYAKTEDIANNEISMPVYGKYGLGINVSNDVKIEAARLRGIAPNDGECVLNTTEMEVSGYRHTKPSWAKNSTEWFSSSVYLRRFDPVPGIQKTVAGETKLPTGTVISPTEIYGPKYDDGNPIGTPITGTVPRTSIVNWKIRAFNEGGAGANSTEDYWIEDTVDAPYRFTGNFFYDIYSADKTIYTRSPVPIFSLGGRTETDTTVQISTNKSKKDSATLTLDSTITVNGPPVSVDGGRAEVQLLRDNDGNETIRIHFKDNYHRLPPNSYMELYAHTQFVGNDTYLSKQFYNHVELIPSKEFDPMRVAQGRVLYREGEQIPYGVESGASVTMTAGYSTAARKQVTELADTTNTGWSDNEKNAIVLPDKRSAFRYDLYIDLPEDDVTSRLVMIDSLPEPGDHSPFVDRDLRDSAFTVHMLSEDLGLNVWTAEDHGEGTKTALSYSDYTFEVSTKNDFTPEDWDGAASGWNTIDLSDGLSASETTLIENARSFRLTIHDADLLENPQNALMGEDTQVQVRFNAELESPEDADPGAVAWNSFGYRYTVPIGNTGIAATLNAEPLKVGVQVPAVPTIRKELKTPADHYREGVSNSEYRFLIYSGEAIPALNDITNMSMADIASELTSRDVLITSVTIPGGGIAADTGFLDEEKKWTYDASQGKFVETATDWTWQNLARYTIIELPWDENGFRYGHTQYYPLNNYTFTQNAEHDLYLKVANVWKYTGDILLSKTVQGPSFSTTRKFTFTIHLQDGVYPVYGTFDYEGTNIPDGTLVFDADGNASIRLKHNQAIKIKNIPSGYTYSVTEADDEWYTPQSQNAEGTIERDTVHNVSFTNTRRSTTLTTTKVVQGNYGDRHELFDFEVYITDEGRELSGTYNATITHLNAAAETTTLTFTDGAATFRLKHGDSLVINGLPYGARYSVDELGSSGYTTSSENEVGVLGDPGPVVTYTNAMWGATPTGIAATGGILVLIAGIAMIVMRKRGYIK